MLAIDPGGCGDVPAPTLTDVDERSVIVERMPIDGHDGHAGSLIERVRLDDGSQWVLKHLRADDPLRAYGADPFREVRWWQRGVVLPDGVVSPVRDAYASGEDWVLVLEDISAHLVRPPRRLSEDELRRIVAALRSIYDAFAGARSDDLAEITTGNVIMAPETLLQLDGEFDLAAVALAGWERFFAEAPSGAAAAVRGVHADLNAFGASLLRRPSSLLHGDVWHGNLGLSPDTVYLLDWGMLTTWGPPAIELLMFLALSHDLFDVTHDEFLDLMAEELGPWHDEEATELALLGTLAAMGWDKPAGQTDLEWWCDRIGHPMTEGTN